MQHGPVCAVPRGQPQPPNRFNRVAEVAAKDTQPLAASTPGVTFQATVYNVGSNERLYLVGAVEDLGEWDEAHAKPMCCQGQTWSIWLELRPYRKIQYKYILISTEGEVKSWVQWEKGPNSADREFYWDGVSTTQDDGVVSSFLEKKPLQKRSYYQESQDIATAHGSENSVSVSSGWGWTTEDVPKHRWVCDMFEKMQSAIQCLEQKLESQTTRQQEAQRSVNRFCRILISLEDKIGDVEDRMKDAERTRVSGACQAENEQEADCDRISQLIEQHLADCSLSQKQQYLEIDMDCLQQRMRNTDARLEKMESVMVSHKEDLASHSKSLVRLQRLINDLEVDSAAQEIQQTQQVKDLKSQVDSLSGSLHTISENSTSEPPPTAVRGDVQQPQAQAAVAQHELHERNEVGSKPDDLGAAGHIHQAPSKTKPAFCGFQVPPKPTDGALAKVCLEVEEELFDAVRRNDPVDARKSLLRKVLPRLHPDKTGKASAGMNWIEDWKNTHIAWYYQPHPVPEDQQKYLAKRTSAKDP